MPKDLESRRMKCQKVLKEPPGRGFYPSFLHEGGDGAKGHPSAPESESGAFKPAWGGFRIQDSIMGNTKLARDWSVHSIPLVDFKDFVLLKDLEVVDLLRSQAHTVIRLFSLILLFSL